MICKMPDLPPLSPMPKKPTTNKPKETKPIAISSKPSPMPKPAIKPIVDASTLQQKLAEKETEMAELNALFIDIKNSYETVNSQNENFKVQIDTLKTTLEMKDEQLQMKDEQMESYSKTIDQKNTEIENLKTESTNASSSLIEEKDQLIEELQSKIHTYEDQIQQMENEMKLLKDDIEAADKEVEELNQKIKPSSTEGQNAIYLSRDQVIQRFRDVLKEGLHNVNLCVPYIEDLSDLDLYEIKSTVNLKIACDIDSSNGKHVELMQEFQALDNISLRVYDGHDRWTLIKDNEALLIAAVGEEMDNYLAFYTADPKQIQLFNSLAMESWLRGRKP
jgi:chromosome segregation ATPase